MIRLAFALCLAAMPLAAQGTLITSPIDGSQTELRDIEDEGAPVKALSGNGATLRGLDKVSGEVLDFELSAGDTANLGRIEVTLTECRYPEDNQAGEAFAWVTVSDPRREAPIFDGWMSANSPALNAVDHPRYDVWVIRCTSA